LTVTCDDNFATFAHADDRGAVPTGKFFFCHLSGPSFVTAYMAMDRWGDKADIKKGATWAPNSAYFASD